ncbi:hypothetical protein FISHEDRAFT_57690 [Fistulina hepatica ATCC 64428]|uniref:Transmembrane protein n=1 Tax=Fistulina hepatica ATCC 64428 TaxID=1128425 RepID=A0A0D7AGY4_9AGAR|nr:hypothetical protein FISHEDRAFT_57690 [Fistulina hepatica ATCC 64428]
MRPLNRRVSSAHTISTLFVLLSVLYGCLALINREHNGSVITTANIVLSLLHFELFIPVILCTHCASASLDKDSANLLAPAVSSDHTHVPFGNDVQGPIHNQFWCFLLSSQMFAIVADIIEFVSATLSVAHPQHGLPLDVLQFVVAFMLVSTGICVIFASFVYKRLAMSAIAGAVSSDSVLHARSTCLPPVSLSRSSSFWSPMPPRSPSLYNRASLSESFNVPFTQPPLAVHLPEKGLRWILCLHRICSARAFRSHNTTPASSMYDFTNLRDPFASPAMRTVSLKPEYSVYAVPDNPSTKEERLSAWGTLPVPPSTVTVVRTDPLLPLNTRGITLIAGGTPMSLSSKRSRIAKKGSFPLRRSRTVSGASRDEMLDIEEALLAQKLLRQLQIDDSSGSISGSWHGSSSWSSSAGNWLGGLARMGSLGKGLSRASS